GCLGRVWILQPFAGERWVPLELPDHGRPARLPGTLRARALGNRTPALPALARRLRNLRCAVPSGRIPVCPWWFEASRGSRPRRRGVARGNRILAWNLNRLRAYGRRHMNRTKPPSAPPAPAHAAPPPDH